MAKNALKKAEKKPEKKIEKKAPKKIEKSATKKIEKKTDKKVDKKDTQKPVEKKIDLKGSKKSEPATVAAKLEKAPKKEKFQEDTNQIQEEIAEKPAETTKVKAPKKTKESVAKLAAAKLLGEEVKMWSELKEKFGSQKAVNYSMSGVFETQTPIVHKVLGWGFIVSVQNDRLEVLFEQGTKILISNYKAS